MSALGLNEHHQLTVMHYMRFARYQRGQRLKGVEASFDDLKTSRLIEDTFTVDEVTEMLDGLLSVVRGEVESELINTAHTNVLLLRQLFQQAEKWHLKLAADISELENRELLEQIKDFEEAAFSGSRKDTGHMPTLTPMNESGGSALLQMEIQRLNDENEKLKERLKVVETQALDAKREKDDLKSALDRAGKSSVSKPGPSVSNSKEIDELRQQVKQLSMQLNEATTMGRQSSSALEGDLAGTKHELLKARDLLEMTEKELEKKVSQTAPYKNLKSMMQKKNDQIKDLRKRLGKYESLDD